ncbi:MAG: DUF4367 domain-containing protein [Thermoanaerobacteraceae bacterium]|nr:DUF4367 domain-containing protein [Thermoanaerobacteraceae bacterium]
MLFHHNECGCLKDSINKLSPTKTITATIFSCTVLSKDSVAGVDSENAYTETIKVNGDNAEYFFKDKISILLFKYDGIVFLLQGSLPKNELIKIAESMKYTKTRNF